MVGYVAAPDVLVVLVHKFLSLRPSMAIECGSGTSTLFLAVAAQQYGVDCRLVSLEHDLAYAEATRTLVADHGVGHLVDIRHAPLTTTPLTDHSGPWYDPAAFEDLHDIGLATVLRVTSDRRLVTRWFPCSRTGWRILAPSCWTTRSVLTNQLWLTDGRRNSRISAIATSP